MATSTSTSTTSLADTRNVDLMKLLKQVEHILSAREKQFLLDIGKRDAELDLAHQQISTLTARLRQAEQQCTALRAEVQDLADRQARELAQHVHQLDDLQKKHAQLLEIHNEASKKSTKKYDKVVKQKDKLAAALNLEKQAKLAAETQLNQALAQEKSLSDQVDALTARKRALMDRCGALQDAVNKHQGQVNVANKRLDDLKQDHCVRVNDLEARLKSIQASSRKSLEEMKDALAKQQEVTRTVTEENVSYRRQLAERSDRYGRLEVNNQSLQDEVKLLQKQLTTSRQDANQQRERVVQLEANVATKDDMIRALESTEKDKCSAECSVLRDDLAKVKHQLSQKQGIESHLRQQLGTAEARLDLSESNCAKLRADLKLSLSEVTNFQQLLMDAQTREAQLHDDIKVAERRGEQQAKSRLDALVLRVAEQQSDCLRHQQALANAARQCHDLVAARDDLQQKLQDVEDERDALLRTLKKFIDAHQSLFPLPPHPVPAHPLPSTSTTTTTASSSSLMRLPSRPPNVILVRPGPDAAERTGALPTEHLLDEIRTIVDSSNARLDGKELADLNDHKPTDGSVVSQLLTELTTALLPSTGPTDSNISTSPALAATNGSVPSVLHTSRHVNPSSVLANVPAVSNLDGSTAPARRETPHQHFLANSAATLSATSLLSGVTDIYGSIPAQHESSQSCTISTHFPRCSPAEAAVSTSSHAATRLSQPRSESSTQTTAKSPTKSKQTTTSLQHRSDTGTGPTAMAAHLAHRGNLIPTTTNNTSSTDQFVTDFLAQNSIESDVSRLLDRVTWSDIK